MTDCRTYEIRVTGQLDDHWRGRLGEVSLLRDPDGTTTVTVAAADQARLHGVLAGLRDIGADLLAVHVLEADPVLTRPLRTERLVLRAATPDDAEATWAYRRLPQVNRWLTAAPADLDTYRTIFTRPDRLATTLVVTLAEAPDGAVVGDLMLRLEDAWSQRDVADRARRVQAELGWVIDPAHAGRGYATEAVRELVRFCFEDLGLRRVVASCFADNVASWRLMERLGMRREAHAVRESLHRSGEWLDGLGYAVLADEWRTTVAS